MIQSVRPISQPLTTPPARVTILANKGRKGKRTISVNKTFRADESANRGKGAVASEVHGDVTRLLGQATTGNTDAKNALFVLVYDELRAMAHARMRVERIGHTWGSTGLVHEVYFRLMKGQHVFTKDRRYFFKAASRAMDQLLREHALKRKCRPHGHLDPEGCLLLDELADDFERTFKVDLFDLTDALVTLQAIGRNGARRHEVVTLRIWGGLTYQEIADELGVAVATVDRDWQSARAWLYARLKGRKSND